MADDNPVTAPAEAEKPENTSADRPDEVSETVATSDQKTTGKKDSICIHQSAIELLLEAAPRSG